MGRDSGVRSQRQVHARVTHASTCKARPTAPLRCHAQPFVAQLVLSAACACSLVCGAAGQCSVENAIDVDDPPGAGVNCSCNVGFAGDGAVSCTACAAGTAKGVVGPVGQDTPCTACVPGYYSSSTGQTACMPCRAGSFVRQSGQTGCTNCTAGRYAKTGASICIDCPAGTFGDAWLGSGWLRDGFDLAPGLQENCTLCFLGKYSAAVQATTNATCATCDAGSFSTKGASICTDCGAGTFSFQEASACTECSIGKYSTAAGTKTGVFLENFVQVEYFAANSPTVCTFCSAGFYTDSLGSSMCHGCIPGKYAYASASACTDCAPGKASPWTSAQNDTVCNDCKRGSWAAAAYAQCTMCAPGKSGNVSAAESELSCEICAGGLYSRAGQPSPCPECAAGKYSSIGASTCTNCSAGTFSPATGLGACQCTTAINEFECPETKCAPVCSACSAGNFSLEGSSVCQQCAPGSFSAQSESGFCELCEEGHFQENTESTFCEQCPINTYGNTTGLSGCYACPQYLYSRKASVAVEDCRTAQIEISPDDPDWGPIMEAAPTFAMIFLRPGTYTGYCNLEVNAVKIEGMLGAEKTIIDCQGVDRHFHIDGTRNITVIGVTLANGYKTDEDGGCIWLTRGVLTLADSLLVNCSTGRSGGAIHINTLSILDVRYATFENCYASLNGGCLNIKNSTVRMKGTSFRNARADRIGGALYLEDISDLRSELGSFFFNNSASGGGAMAFQGVKIKAEISNVEFINNRATGSTDGVCTAGTESLCAGGGAVLVLDITEVQLTQCKFEDNYSNHSGGALKISARSEMDAQFTEFKRNEARLYGGAVRVGVGSTFTGSSNSFVRNVGRTGGGVIAFSDSSDGGSLQKSKFIFDPLTAYLGGPQGITMNFAVCLNGANDLTFQGDQFEAFLQQPCALRRMQDEETGEEYTESSCIDYTCWGVQQVGWTGSSCQMLADGWRPSRVAGCGDLKNWLWPLMQLPEDYYMFAEPPPPPHMPPANNPELETPDRSYYAMLAAIQQAIQASVSPALGGGLGLGGGR